MSATIPRRRLRLSWSDPWFRNGVYQVVIVGLVAGVLLFLVTTTRRNLESRHIATGFDFLRQRAGLSIGEGMLDYDTATSTYAWALFDGLLNTLKVAVIGVVLTTALGTLVGIGRLSRNWLIARATAVYVEVLRDVPVLLQLVLWHTLLQGLPSVLDAFRLGPAFLSQKGLQLPRLLLDGSEWWILLALLIGGVIAWRLAPRWPVAMALVLAPPAAVWLAFGAPFGVEIPVQRGKFGFNGGVAITPEFTALLGGLVIYTSSYVAEIVRAGIQSVPNGQWEAAGALGLRRGTILRRVVLPQALRVIIPPMTSQYLNLTKNSSLALAVGYPDIVSVSQSTLNQTGQSIEVVAIFMAAYLSISLSISALMNWYNARIALVER